MGCLEAEYRMAHKEFKPDLKRLKLLKNVKDFIEYLKESKRVFHSKKKSSNLSFC
jgi:L-rhamnose mutarotase